MNIMSYAKALEVQERKVVGSRTQRRLAKKRKFNQNAIMQFLGKTWLLGVYLLKLCIKIFMNIFVIIAKLAVIGLDILKYIISFLTTIATNTLLMVKDHIITNLKTESKRKNLVIECLCIVLLCSVSGNFLISKEKAKLEAEIAQYSVIVEESEKLIKQFQSLQEKQQEVSEVEVVESEFNKVIDISTKALTEFNLPTPSADNFDSGYISSVKHDILEDDDKIEVMNWIEEEYSKNFNSNARFNPLDVTQISKLSESEFLNIVKNSSFANNLTETQMKQLAKGCYKAESDYQVNGLFLMSIAALESGWGSSTIAKEKNNFTGFNAYDKNAKSSAKTFTSVEDCILATANKLKLEYLTETEDDKSTANIYEGLYYNGKSIFDINVKYCSQIDWSGKLVDLIGRL
jgi:beta-N-acetylglucosaminidase